MQSWRICAQWESDLILFFENRKSILKWIDCPWAPPPTHHFFCSWFSVWTQHETQCVKQIYFFPPHTYCYIRFLKKTQNKQMKTPQKTHHTSQRTPNTKTTDNIHTSLKQNIKYMKKIRSCWWCPRGRILISTFSTCSRQRSSHHDSEMLGHF